MSRQKPGHIKKMSWTGFEPATFGMTNQHSAPELPAVHCSSFETGIEPVA